LFAALRQTRHEIYSANVDDVLLPTLLDYIAFNDGEFLIFMDDDDSWLPWVVISTCRPSSPAVCDLDHTTDPVTVADYLERWAADNIAAPIRCSPGFMVTLSAAVVEPATAKS
jgi:hypothetical protein